MDALYIVPISGLVALVFAGIFTYYISSKPRGDKKMQEISDSIHKGALAFLKEEYKIISIFVAVVVIVLLITSYFTDLSW